MNAQLLREREAFKKRALANPVVESRKRPPAGDSDSSSSKKKQSKASNASSTPSAPKMDFNFKSSSGSSQYKFSVLAKIVKYMKTRHLDGHDFPLSIEEILDETNQLDVISKVKNWLITEALANNPKIDATNDGKYIFKPPFLIKDRKSLLKLLRRHDLKGLGGILLEDIAESLPNYEKALKALSNDIMYIVRQQDKKKIVFYNDKLTSNFQVDDEFQKLWRSVGVEGVDAKKIEEYLDKQGIKSMQDHGLKKALPIKRKGANRKRTFKKPKDNVHIDNLKNYDM